MESLQHLTLRHVLERSASMYSSHPALSHVGGEPITFQELSEHAQELGTWLREEGIGFGDKVAILSESCVNWGIVYFAVTSMGAIAVPILPEFHIDAVQHILRHSEAKAVFVSERLYPKVEEFEQEGDLLCINMDTFTLIEKGTTRDMLRDLKSMGLREFRKLRNKAMQLGTSQPSAPTEDDIAAIIYTSGTTGHSKGVMLTHRNIVWDADTVHHLVQVGPGDRMLSILPLSHTYECTLGLVVPVLNGAHVHYLDKPPTARVLLPALATVRPTVMLSVPLVIEKMFKASILPKLTGTWIKQRLYAIPFFRRKLNAIAGRKLRELFGGELRCFCIGGAGIAPDVELFLREAHFPYAIGYGLTETAPLVAGSGPEATRLTSTGYALPGVEIRIDAPDPTTGEGEIIVRSPNVMRGYYKGPQITESVLTPDGWFRTGDLGKFDADGYLYIKGRLKNVIIGPSGENIYPEEIEAVIHQSPYVMESLVYQSEGKLIARIHLDSARLDEEFANLTAAQTETEVEKLLETLRRDVNSKVSSFIKLAKVINQQEPFEKTPTHKIKRYLYVE